MKDKIDRFYGEYAWLSNFWPCKITVFYNECGYEASTLEHAYQASKARNKDDFDKILKLDSAGKAKRFGKKIELRSMWSSEEFRISTMRDLVRQKFSDRNPKLKISLLNTRNSELIEGNNWHDNFWGICNCGSYSCRMSLRSNWLGKILMEIREEWK